MVFNEINSVEQTIIHPLSGLRFLQFLIRESRIKIIFISLKHKT